MYLSLQFLNSFFQHKLFFRGDGLFREKELDARQALYDGTYLRQVRFDSPLWVCIDGRSNKGMVREGKND